MWERETTSETDTVQQETVNKNDGWRINILMQIYREGQETCWAQGAQRKEQQKNSSHKLKRETERKSNTSVMASKLDGALWGHALLFRRDPITGPRRAQH